MPSKPIFFLILIFLSIALLASITLNVHLFRRGQQYYLQLNSTRLDPLGLSYYPLEASQQDLRDTGKLSVVFFGDSRAASWPSPGGLTEFSFINRGIGAQTSAQALQRFDEHITPLHPQVIVIQVGINDLKTIPLFPEQKEKIIANCRENLRQIVAQAIDLGAMVVLTTIFPVGEVPLERRLFWSEDVAEAVVEVNSYIHTLQGPDVLIFDAYTHLVDKDGILWKEYAQDELHLNPAGYEALNRELVKVLP